MSENEIKLAIIGGKEIALDKAHYDKVIAAKESRTKVYERWLEPNTGDAFFLKAGQVIRMEQRHAITQIADWWWVSPDLKQQQASGNTHAFEGQYVKQYSRIWSGIENMRPMATMVTDESPDDFPPPGFFSHFWAYHCSPTWHQAGFRELPAGHNACHVNAMHGFHRLPAVHAIKDEEERRDKVQQLANNSNYQTFQPAKFYTTDEGQLSIDLAVGKPVPEGTGVEFYAEMDVYAVLSLCPWGDQSKGPVGADLVPLHISVWDTGIEPLPPADWKDWKGAFYEAVAKGDKDISPRTGDSY